MSMIPSSESLRRVGLLGLGMGEVEYYTAPTDTYVLTDPLTVQGNVTPVDYYVAPTDQYTLNPPSSGGLTIPILGGSGGSTQDWLGSAISSIASLFKFGGSSATAPQTSQTVQKPQTVGTVSASGSLVPGIPNTYLAIGAGALVLVLMMSRRSN